MTSPHSPYAHGSSYYPPPHMYGSHSPGPYSYAQYGPPPNHTQPAPRQNGRGGAYSARSPNQYGYYPPPQYPHPAAVPLHAPNPHHQYPGKYAQQPFQPPYAPPYPNPAAMPFTPPPRHTPQPLSPLPKQLSMPNGFYDPSSHSPATFRPSSHPDKPSFPIFTPAAIDEPAPPEPSSEPPPPTAEETPPSPLPASSTPYDRMGTIDTVGSSPPKSTTSSQPPSQSTALANPTVTWAIWSRRPHDPLTAPGIIISPRARPPQSVVEQAIDEKTPPPSPTQQIRRLPKHKQRGGDDGYVGAPVLEVEGRSAVSSTAVTETNEESTAPGSPVSSHTSVSASVGPAKEEEVEVTASAEPEEVTPTPESVVSIALAEVEAPSTSDVEAAEGPEAKSPPSEPAPAPSTSKRSWASLLRPTDSTSKNSLPTSSVVGISIPAGLPSSSSSSSSSSLPDPLSKKAELINLLTTTPPSSSPFTGRIKPRGLVNSGNMCFANSVLQILVYCAPFSRLFAELGRVLPEAQGGAGVGGSAGGFPTVGSSASLGGSMGKAGASATPLVDATAVFLREFGGERKKKHDGGGGVGRGAAGAWGSAMAYGRGAGVAPGYGRGKGKERRVEEEDEEDEWELDSFLPSYIYDAMKEKKRFDSMRGGQQEDAEEFLGFYLDTLEEELLLLLNSVNPPAKPQVEEREEEVAAVQDEGWMEVGKKNRMVITRTTKATESPITRIFGGKFRSTLRAPRQKDSVVVEDWRSLRLDIQRDQIRTIQDALSYISHPQPVQVTLSTQPGVPVEATQQVLIEALPPVLVLQMKRFCYDVDVKGVVKVGKQVTFGPELEIGPDLMAPSVRKSTGTKYKLFGALYHHGQSASGGHYTLDVLHPTRFPGSTPPAGNTTHASNANSTAAAAAANTPANATANANASVVNPRAREGWIRIDDELVSDVRPEDVFGGQERDDSRCAYLLFYRRVW